MSDTSTAYDRKVFVSSIEGGGSDANFAAHAAAVASCQMPLPVTSAYLLAMPDGTTFAQGAAEMLRRIASGRAPA